MTGERAAQVPADVLARARRAARDWAAEHRHQQPDDRMLNVVAAEIFAAGVAAGRTQAAAEPVRAIAVVNWRRGTVHGLTHDHQQARAWCRELIDQYGGDALAATQTVGLVYPRRTSVPGEPTTGAAG